MNTRPASTSPASIRPALAALRAHARPASRRLPPKPVFENEPEPA